MDVYKFNLNTYKYPPVETCTVQELEQICEERLQLYRIMDSAVILKLKPNTKKWEEYVQSKIVENKLRTYFLLLKDEKYSVGLIRARRNDHIAHWLLSLCYCRTHSLRYFFMCCELYWFVMLYKRMGKEDLKEFLMQNEFNYTQVHCEEKELLADRLFKCRSIDLNTFNNITYYKMRFSEVPNLIAVRNVFLYRGFAYLPEADIIFWVKNRLWRQFNQQLAWTSRVLPMAIKEDRVQDFLTDIPVVMPANKYLSDEITGVNLHNIDRIADNYFPLCMKTIHSVLQRDHHLKYDCKMQYGVFLKCLGLPYEDAMQFWKSEFTKKMTSDWFDRKYAYLFKHQYGKVGSMLDYKAYSCEKILEKCPSVSQHHGCPFKHWDLDKLMEKCQTDGLRTADINDIKQLVENNQFKEACTVYLCGSRKVVRDEVIQSPNHYFKLSYKLESSLDDYLDSMFESCETEVDL